MLAIAYRYSDPLDPGDRVFQAVSNGLFHCVRRVMCDHVCAQDDKDHLGLWAMLRAEAEERGLTPSYAE